LAATFSDEYGRHTEEYDLALQICKETGKKFEDPKFPADKSSLCPNFSAMPPD
jgi:hypothetical protein